MENLRRGRNQEERVNGMVSHIFPMGMHAAVENEKSGEDGMRHLYREMEDWYREEANHSVAGTV